jgi:hypothetical protein
MQRASSNMTTIYFIVDKNPTLTRIIDVVSIPEKDLLPYL